MLVVLNHLRIHHFEGGYVGVDVFFVISGYLIGGPMIAEFGRGGFSLAGFYERRVRRIFPALLVMLAVVSLLAYRVEMPDALRGDAESLLATLVSGANVYFAGQAGYFDAPSSSRPLLHTWSLAVEEQFYISLPVLLWMVFRWRPRGVRAVLWGCSLVSFGATLWVMRFAPAWAFFWSPLRAWELLVGVLVSQYAVGALRHRAVRELAAAMGLGMVLVPALTYSAQTPFPGVAALWPCLGAVLIVAAGQAGGSATAWVLGLRPVVFVGLISYSLYLWHWPLIVLQSAGGVLTDASPDARATKVLLLAVSVGVAALSWWLVETPFRLGLFKQGRWKPGRGRLFAMAGAATAALACCGVGVLRGDGLPGRFAPEVVRLASYTSWDVYAQWRMKTCFLVEQDAFSDFRPDVCLNAKPGRKTYLLYGDSAAGQLYPGLVAAFPEVNVQQATVAACLPYEDPVGVPVRFKAICSAMWRFVHEVYLPSQRPDAVILAGLWDEESPGKLGAAIAAFQQRGIRVILMGPPIVFDQGLPHLLSAAMRRDGSPAAMSAQLGARLRPQSMDEDRRMEAMARETWHVDYVSYFEVLCRGKAQLPAGTEPETAQGCPLFAAPGEPLLFDTHHFTLAGSELFARAVRAQGLLQ
jgi:peptidoglycan/LPS O-acetylase OafA/YrhL